MKRRRDLLMKRIYMDNAAQHID
ncbi:hypothetical protein KEJ23_07305, partial [Candidatus Bathyarchaeota archaeon]|nr:hypothetical protein [Candidatus Bathyarchaeota archaeon]